MRFNDFKAKTPHARSPVFSNPRPRDFQILDLLQDYDGLFTSYICEALPAASTTEDRLTQLKIHGLVAVSPGWAHPLALSRERPLSITPLGESFLQKHGKRRLREKVNDNSCGHRIFRSLMKYHRSKFKGTKDYPTRIDLPDGSRLHPDEVWSISVGAVSLNFLEEDDTGSETISKQFADKLEKYVECLSRRLDREAYGFNQVNVLIHTTKEGRVANILKLIEEEVPAEYQPRFLVKSVPDFIEEPLLLPNPAVNLLDTHYTRVVEGKHKTFTITQTLERMTNGRRESTSETARAESRTREN